MTQALYEALQAVVGAEAVLTGNAALPFLTEWRGAFWPEAAAVVQPADTEAVASVVRACAVHGAALVTQSGNTGLVGGSAASDSDNHILLSLVRMDAVRAVDVNDNTMTVEAGCILADVKQAAADAGRYFPLALASADQCRIGGNLGTNAGGLNVLRYGNARDLTLGLEVVLADGRVWSSLSPLRKDNSGFDLRNLFIGSEGALGIITAATLKLSYAESERATALCAIARPADALAITRSLDQRSGNNVVACELISNQAVQLVREYSTDTAVGIELNHAWYVLIELASSATGCGLAEVVEDVLSSAEANGTASVFSIAETEQQRLAQWQLREFIPAAQRSAGASIKHDISLAPDAIPEFLDTVLRDIERLIPGVRPCPFGHLGDGNIHFNLTRPVDGDDSAFLAHIEAAHQLVHDRVVERGGSIAAEHGIGRLKVADLARYKTSVEQDLSRSLKTALDPDNRLNPGVMIDGS